MPASRSRRRRDLRWSFAGFRPPRRRPLQGRGMACDAARILRQSQGRRRVTLPLAPKLKTGVMTMHRRNEPATGPWEPRIDELRHLVELVDRLDRKSTRLNSITNAHLVCRLLLEKKQKKTNSQH